MFCISAQEWQRLHGGVNEDGTVGNDFRVVHRITNAVKEKQKQKGGYLLYEAFIKRLTTLKQKQFRQDITS